MSSLKQSAIDTTPTLEQSEIEAYKQRIADLENREAISQKTIQRLERVNKEILASQFRLDLPKAPKRRTGKSRLRVIASDLHGQQMDKAAFGAFVRDLEVIQPDEIILLGDWIDCGGWLSEHPTLHLGETEGSFADDIEAGNQSLDRIQQAAPKASIDCMEGNHEWRVLKTQIKLCRGNRADIELMKRLWGCKRLLNLDERGIRFYAHDQKHDGCAVRGMIARGDWRFTHGPFRKGGVNAVRSNLSAIKRNFCQGHIHRLCHQTQQTADEQIIEGWCFGCLCKLSPLYNENNTLDWGHGYGLQEVDRNGTAATYGVTIRDGVSRLSALTKRLSK